MPEGGEADDDSSFPKSSNDDPFRMFFPGGETKTRRFFVAGSNIRMPSSSR